MVFMETECNRHSSSDYLFHKTVSFVDNLSGTVRTIDPVKLLVVIWLVGSVDGGGGLLTSIVRNRMCVRL